MGAQLERARSLLGDPRLYRSPGGFGFCYWLYGLIEVPPDSLTSVSPLHKMHSVSCETSVSVAQ